MNTSKEKNFIPGGTSTFSKRKSSLFGSYNGPGFFIKAKGSRIVADNGKEYVDFGMALGSSILGYSPEPITKAVKKILKQGWISTLPSHLEQDLAERVCSIIQSIDMVRFFKTGAEALLAGVRCARVYTGRESVLTCGYHGWLDWTRSDKGVPRCIKELRKEFKFNDIDSFKTAFNESKDIPAAVVLEPVIREKPKPEFIEFIENTCKKHGVVFILDEIKTGIRLGIEGAQKRYNINPDMTVLGKAVAGGFPLSILGGKRDLMEAIEKTWVSSTFAGEALSLGASLALIDFCIKENVPQRIEELGKLFFAGIKDIEKISKDFFKVYGIPQMNGICAPDDYEAMLISKLSDKGFILKMGGYNFVSYAHTEKEINDCIECVIEAAKEICKGK